MRWMLLTLRHETGRRRLTAKALRVEALIPELLQEVDADGPNRPKQAAEFGLLVDVDASTEHLQRRPMCFRPSDECAA